MEEAKAGFEYKTNDNDEVVQVVRYLKGTLSDKAEKLALQFDAVNKKKKELEAKENALKEELKPFIADLFSAQDKVYTRVAETAKLLLQLSKESTKENFNKKSFLDKIYAEFPKLSKQFDALIKECTDIVDVSPSIKVTPKKENIKEGIGNTIKSVYDKVKEQVKKFVDGINVFLNDYDKKLAEWKKELGDNPNIGSDVKPDMKLDGSNEEPKKESVQESWYLRSANKYLF